MFVRSTTAGADAHCVNADVEAHTRHADRTVRWNWRGTGRGAISHYDVLDSDALCALPVADLAADDCALFLWATDPQLPRVQSSRLKSAVSGSAISGSMPLRRRLLITSESLRATKTVRRSSA